MRHEGQFLRHFRPAQDRHKGHVRVDRGFAQIRHFTVHEQASHCRLQILSNPCRGGMRAVCRPEGVIDIHLAQASQGLGKGGIIGFLFRVKA
jgi:hypothetical protein